MELLSMTNYILKISKEERQIGEDIDAFNFRKLNKINRYCDFLKQPLKLSMFIPCDENEFVLLSPDEIKQKTGVYHPNHTISINGRPTTLYYYTKLYDKAKKKILFEGFYYQENTGKNGEIYRYVRNKNPHVFSFEQLEHHTVESLLTGYKDKFLIKLTENGEKEINIL